MYQWNASDYARHSAAQEQWAHELLASAGLVRDDRVLDVGCGDGRITAAIVARALVPGGRCVLQMGGRGNAAAVIRAFDVVQRLPEWRDWFSGFESSYGFHGDDDYRLWLSEAGLVPDRVALIEKDMVHADRVAFEGWLRTAWHPYTSPVPADRRTALVDTVVDRYLEESPPDVDGRIHVKMMRLQVEARLTDRS